MKMHLFERKGFMNFADMHCDTAMEMLEKGKKLKSNDLHISLDKVPFEGYIQTFAHFTHDNIKTEDAFDYYLKMHNVLLKEIDENKKLIRQINKKSDMTDIFENGGYGALFSVENGKIIGNELSRIEKLRKDGIKIFSFTWNAANQLAGGCESDEDFTKLGLEAVKELENQDIILDVSHLNQKSFYTLYKNSKKPLIATHSNCYSICSHRRNLTDEQIKLIFDRKGIVGINLLYCFIKDAASCNIDDMMKHIEHYLELGGEDFVAFGTDFDGIDKGPEELKDISYMPLVVKEMEKRNYSKDLIEKIMYKNFYNFMIKNMGE